MSFKVGWNIDQISRDLYKAYSEAANPRNDGYTAWYCKKDLLRIKYELDHMIERLPNFGDDESKYHEEIIKLKMWGILNERM